MQHYSHLEDYIKKKYIQMEICSPTDLDFNRVAKHFNIKVFFWKQNSQALFLRKSAFIFLSEDLSPSQTWQDFIHELCHVLLHTGDQMQMTSLFREYQEYKATNFTYHACVPTFMLQQLELPRNTFEAARMIQETFNVEYDFAMTRLTQYINNHHFIPSWNTSR